MFKQNVDKFQLTDCGFILPVIILTKSSSFIVIVQSALSVKVLKKECQTTNLIKEDKFLKKTVLLCRRGYNEIIGFIN